MIELLAVYLVIGFVVALATVVGFSWHDSPDNIILEDDELLFMMAVTGVTVLCIWPVVLVGALFAALGYWSLHNIGRKS